MICRAFRTRRKPARVADDDEIRRGTDFRQGERLCGQLGTDAGGVAHGEREDGTAGDGGACHRKPSVNRWKTDGNRVCCMLHAALGVTLTSFECPVKRRASAR